MDLSDQFILDTLEHEVFIKATLEVELAHPPDHHTTLQPDLWNDDLSPL